MFIKADKLSMRNTNYIIFILTFLSVVSSFDSHAGCQQFETALEKAMARLASRGEATTVKSGWSSPEALDYKKLYASADHSTADNVKFIERVNEENIQKTGRSLYFSMENRFQKKLNDSIMKDKGMVDAVNNSMLQKFNSNLPDYPLAKKYLEAKAMGFKNVDMEMLSTPQLEVQLEHELNELYQKTNSQFARELQDKGLTKLIDPRTDGAGDVSTWFLSGTGETALKANLATRYARKMGFSNGNAHTVHFKDIEKFVYADVMEIEKLRKELQLSSNLIKNGMMEKLPSGKAIPSYEMVEILRKVKPDECLDYLDYINKVRAKVKNQFNSSISEHDIDNLTAYFKAQDSLSPPIFSPERVEINLGEANHDIISVDFSGVGVNNARAQMRALSSVDYNQADKSKLLDMAFVKIQNGVDEVTAQMNKAKDYFAKAIRTAKNDAGADPKYSGDDGIAMTSVGWDLESRKKLVSELGKYEDPSTFRVTNSKVKTTAGTKLPTEGRSPIIVRSEILEKDIRSEVVGHLKIPSSRARNMIFTIDFIPGTTGGKFNLIIGGIKPTPNELKLIVDAFKKSLKADQGEVLGEIIEVTR
jgi:hypothetical protein